MEKYDVIIIGGGPAGLTAAIYTARRELKTLVLTLDTGGQMNMTQHIENYPGFDMIAGSDLALKMLEQAKKFKAEVLMTSKVCGIEKTEEGYKIKCSNKEYEAIAVILAFGKTPRRLDIENAEKFLGKGLSYCATCDGPFFKGKDVAVVGGGNSALDAALYLTDLAAKVYLIHRRDAFRGEEVLAERLKAKSNAELVLNSTVSDLVGEEYIDAVKVKDVVTNAEREIPITGIFVEIGYQVEADFVKDVVKTDDKNQIIIDQDCKTSDEGVFACGDLTQTPYKQIVIAAGQGATAALSAYDYIQKKLGKPTVRTDWGTK